MFFVKKAIMLFWNSCSLHLKLQSFMLDSFGVILSD